MYACIYGFIISKLVFFKIVVMVVF
jgi:hypothetical protein